MAFEYLKDIGKARDEVKTSSTSEIGKIIEDFANETIDLMKEGVQKASGSMAASIGFEVEYNGDVFIVNFLADDYWDYLNSGVDGVQNSVSPFQNRYGDAYSFKTLNPSRKMVDNFSGNGSMQNWMASKGITSLTYGGETHSLITDADYKSAAYVLARATKRDGIAPSQFVDNALAEDKLRKLEEKLLEMIENIL